MGTVAQPLADRFWAKVGPFTDAGCREWLGYVNPQTGYGQVSVAKADAEVFGSRTVTAPVIACTLAHGPRPAGMEVLHSCDNRRCCEPPHLRWGTPSENQREAWVRNRQTRGEGHHQSKLSDFHAAVAIARCIEGERVEAVAASIGVAPSTVHRWRSGRGRGAWLLRIVDALVLPGGVS